MGCSAHCSQSPRKVHSYRRYNQALDIFLEAEMRMLPCIFAIWVISLLMAPVAQAAESRKEESTRPKIGLVLSGGGARGGAHIVASGVN
jgi:hypothetical protein